MRPNRPYVRPDIQVHRLTLQHRLLAGSGVQTDGQGQVESVEVTQETYDEQKHTLL